MFNILGFKVLNYKCENFFFGWFEVNGLNFSLGDEL